MDSSGDLVDVRLIGFPLKVQQLAAARYDALMREFALMRSEQSDDSVPNRLQLLVDDLTIRFSGFSDLPSADIEAARARGDDSVDLTYRLPSAAGEAAKQFNQLLDEANEYCRLGRHLVTLQETPDILAFRRWFLDEFTAQTAGGSPTPWIDVAAELTTSSPTDTAGATAPDVVEGESVVIAFEGELDIATAENLRRKVNELRDNGARDVIIDASKMSFIDSVGLSILIALHLRLAESGSSLVLRDPSIAVLRMLEIAGLAHQLVVE